MGKFVIKLQKDNMGKLAKAMQKLFGRDNPKFEEVELSFKMEQMPAEAALDVMTASMKHLGIDPTKIKAEWHT